MTLLESSSRKVDPRNVVTLPPLLIPSSSGVATWKLSLPTGPSLIGKSIYAQALVGVSAKPATWRLTNRSIPNVIRR